MAADVQKIVETVFRATDMATAPMRGIAAAAASVGGALARAVSPVTAIVAGVATLGTATGLLSLHSQAEGTSAVLAGMFQTFGQAETFNQGLTLAASTLDQITAAAAALPGEAQDYVNTLQAGFSNFNAIFNGSIQRSVAFGNQMTAIAVSLGVDAAQAARDIARLTQVGRGGAGADVLLWQRLLPYVNRYRELHRETALSADQFNRLTQQQRGELLQNVTAMEGLRGVIDQARSSWDAQLGGFRSALGMMARMATTPLFDAAKDALRGVNSLLMDDNGQLTATARHVVVIGQRISTLVVRGLENAVAHARALRGQFASMGRQIEGSKWFANLGRIANRAANVAQAAAQNPAARNAMLGVGARVALGPAGAAIGPLLSMVSRHGREVDQMLASLSHIGLQALGVFGPMIGVVGTLNDLLGDLGAAVLPPLLGAVDMVTGPLVTFAQGVMGIVDTIVVSLRPHLVGLATDVGGLVVQIGGVLRPALQILGAGLLWVYQHIAGSVIPILTQWVESIRAIIRWLAGILGPLGTRLQAFADRVAPQGRAPTDARNAALDALQRTMGQVVAAEQQQTRQQAVEQRAAAAARRQTPAARGGAHTINDFRNSRFDVTQRFHEGFDPDRIAVAFASDLERMADQRLQSGLEPVFGVR